MNPTEYAFLKLEIFIPETHLSALETALRSVDAGHIGRYDACLSYSRVTSTWRPLAGAAPYSGEAGVVSREPELKVEVTIRSERLDETLRAVRAAHPYEEPVVNVLPLLATGLDGYTFS